VNCQILANRGGKSASGAIPTFRHRVKGLSNFSGILALRKFIQEKDAVVAQGDLARFRGVAAADEADVGDGVVRGAEGTTGDEGVLALQKPHDAVHLGGLDRLLEQHGR